MTSAQLMQSGTGRFSVAALVLVTGLLAGGCQNRLAPPATLQSPHEPGQIWAVVPFVNESGVSTVDANRLADLFTQQLQQVNGINTIPVNRVILAMRRINMPAVASPADARLLTHALDVDAIVVGTVTAYDPYPPPTLGLAVQLYHGGARDRGHELDVSGLVRAPSGTAALGELSPPGPASQAAGVFDGSNHRTLKWLRDYSAGRSVPDGAFGNDTYLMSMELFAQFVSYRLIHDLLLDERARLMPVMSHATPR